MREKTLISGAVVVCILVSSLIVVVAFVWPNLGVGRGAQYRREYTIIATQNLKDGKLLEASKWLYWAGKWGVQSEMKWLQMQDDIESFQSLIEGKNYDEADQVCREVQSILEHGPGSDIWKNFHEDCRNASHIAFNEKIQFCRDRGFEPPENPAQLHDYFSACMDLWETTKR